MGEHKSSSKKNSSRMKRLNVSSKDLEGKTFNCKFCKTKLARADQLITKAPHCRSGRAYLINKVSNFVNEEEEVNLNTMGEHKSSSKKNSSRMKRLNVSSKVHKKKSRKNKSKRLSSSKDDLSSSASLYYPSSPQFLSSDSEVDSSRKKRRHSRDMKQVKTRTWRRYSSQDVSESSPL